MSRFGDTRRQFNRCLHALEAIIVAYGYQYTIEYVKRCDDCPVGHPRSTHKVGLAVDINLYDQENNYLSTGAEHELLHDHWDLLGGARRIDNDLNHYSFEWEGVR